jgi:hypothetical protein
MKIKIGDKVKINVKKVTNKNININKIYTITDIWFAYKNIIMGGARETLSESTRTIW